MTETESNAWIPKTEGERLTGEVIEIIRGWSDARTNGGKDPERGWYPLLRLKTADGRERDWHAFGAVAENRIYDKQPLPGETITVTFLGVSSKTPPKGMNAPKLYRLEVHGRDPVREAQMVYSQLGAPRREWVDAPESLTAPDLA